MIAGMMIFKGFFCLREFLDFKKKIFLFFHFGLVNFMRIQERGL